MNLIAALGTLSIFGGGAIFAILLLARPRREMTENHPETQDDFRQAMERGRHIQERMSR